MSLNRDTMTNRITLTILITRIFLILESSNFNFLFLLDSKSYFEVGFHRGQYTKSSNNDVMYMFICLFGVFSKHIYVYLLCIIF